MNTKKVEKKLEAAMHDVQITAWRQGYSTGLREGLEMAHEIIALLRKDLLAGAEQYATAKCMDEIYAVMQKVKA
jgi:hypothetical protein